MESLLLSVWLWDGEQLQHVVWLSSICCISRIMIMLLSARQWQSSDGRTDWSPCLLHGSIVLRAAATSYLGASSLV